jgi:hypothetical protein
MNVRNVGTQRIIVGPGPASTRADMGEAGAGFILHAKNDKLQSGEPANVRPVTAAQRKVLEGMAAFQALTRHNSYGVEFSG